MIRASNEAPASGGGTKFDEGKDRWDLAPWSAFGEVVKILTFGASKYGDRNWEKGIAFGRLFGAAQRHMTAWWNREDNDPESGRSHLAHALCCLAFLLTFVLLGRKELDDRP